MYIAIRTAAGDGDQFGLFIMDPGSEPDDYI